MINKIEKIKLHIHTLKILLRYEKDAFKSLDQASELIPRKGIRGGRATTVSVRWLRNAEARDKVFNQACEEAKDIFHLRDI